jgi:hypothetical protein
VLKFAGVNEFPRIAKIWEKNLPVVKIDLRTKENWAKYCAKHNGSVNNDGCKFDEVLLSGRKSLYNMFEFSYLEKLNENDINVYLTFNYNKVSLS